MNKNILIGFLIFVLVAFIGYFIWQGIWKNNPQFRKNEHAISNSQMRDDVVIVNPASSKANSQNVLSSNLNAVHQKDTGPIGWNTYSNKKYGFSFSYPNTWSKSQNDINVGDSSGNIMGMNISFIDTVSHTTFLVQYRLTRDLYDYALSQFNSSQGWYASGAKQIKIAGVTAIEAFTAIDKNGKGDLITPRLREILIDFPDKPQTGSFEFQFQTPLFNDKREVTNLSYLLSTFRFGN
ncbi:hypothetical protein HQ865_22750 [Mucilaginibacter mali]|uniref:Uncharacterized protein n=1 Tax=Mucilaginibacter mali TaxID=2740462 RepID=A0A7D4UM19_9SPHI|nr:PsbP-related protein [Mucilaginibacter mali]QKJ32462.1 hypothetical protein HQ865_22750 [Mucilaginibacter mali]